MELKSDTKFQTNSYDLVCKKHFIAYILPIFILFIGLLILLLGVVEGLALLFGTIVTMLSVYKIYKLKNIKWIYSNQKLYIESGVFSWQKASFQVPIEDIYEAYYYKGLLSSMFGYKTIVIRRTDGTTTSFGETKMAGVQQMVNAINEDLNVLKKSKHSNNQVFNTVIVSTGEELKRLSELHQSGYLTDEEFKKEKQKVLQSS